jgi:hypothetical protein
MKVKIVETGREELLETKPEPESGISCLNEFVDNWLGFGKAEKGKIEEVEGEYRCTQATYEWWRDTIREIERIKGFENEAKTRGLWSEKTKKDYEEIINIYGCDLEDLISAQVDFLEELLGVWKEWREKMNHNSHASAVRAARGLARR